MGILNKLNYFISMKTKVLIYNSLIVSHLNLCILAWDYQCDSDKGAEKGCTNNEP